MSPPNATPSSNREEDPLALAEERAALESIARRKRIVDTDADTHAAPDVSSDRIVPSTDAEPEGSLDLVKSAPLGIQQIEDLEDDAKGG